MSLSDQQQQHLTGLLRQRLAIIADHALRDRDPAQHLESLKQVSLQIDSCAAQWQRDLPGQMRHYLTNASYQKALAWLEEQAES